MKQPKVSIGMPVYNAEGYVKASLESLLGQSFGDFELIISDNASTDSSGEICRSAASRDKRIRYVRNEINLGASDNYNAVYRLSTGKYFKWASSNDLCGEHFLRFCVEVLDTRQDVVLVYPRARLFSGDLACGEDYHDGLDLQDESPFQRFVTFTDNMKLNNIMNGLIRSEPLKNSPLIRKFFSSDICLMAELLFQGKFVEVPEPLFFRRMDEQTATRLKSRTELLRHYDPTLRDRMLLQHWKILLAYFGAAMRITLPLGERSKILWYLTKTGIWNRHKLGRELLDFCRRSDAVSGS